jgi:hypothetical protein
MIGDVKNVYDSIDIIVYWSLTLEAVKPTNWLLHGCILACSFNNNTSILQITFTVVTSTCFPLNMYRDICFTSERSNRLSDKT